jgi:hypothetical protein
MLLLTSTSDIIRMVTSATGDIDVHASFIDLASGTVTAGRTNTIVTTATTTTIVAAPAASTSRNVKTLHIQNVHASTANTVTIQHFDGTTSIDLETVTLAAGERIGYVEGVGFKITDASGVPRTSVTRASGSAITAQIASHSADTYYGANLNIAGRVQAGSFFHWRIFASKTAGTAAPTFIIRTGTAGAIGDTARLTMTGPSQTAVADTAFIEVIATFRAVGASAVIRGDTVIHHNLAATGFANTGPAGTALFGGTSGTFDVTPANTIIGLSVNPGASGAWVVENAVLDAVNLLP